MKKTWLVSLGQTRVQMYVISLKMRLLLFLSYLSLYKAEECTGKGEDREDHEIKHYRSGGQEIKRYLKFFFISSSQWSKTFYHMSENKWTIQLI